MLWAKKLEEVQAALASELKKFLATRIKEAKPADLADDLVKNALKIDMSRSAARLRRRLYAQWGRVDFLAGEFYRLTPEGLETRPLVKDPNEVGDLHVDPFRLVSVVKMMGYSGKTRLSAEDRVKGAHLVFSTIFRCTRSQLPPLTPRMMATLMAMQAVEASREVAASNVHTQVTRHFPQWNLQVPTEADTEADIETLRTYGFVSRSDDGTKWRLSERVSLPW